MESENNVKEYTKAIHTFLTTEFSKGKRHIRRIKTIILL